MADVGSTLVSWSSTSSSNSPADATTVGSGLDDNLREIQGVIVRGLSHKGADIASATTTDIGAIEGLFHDITGTTPITNFGTVRAGIWKVLQFDGVLTLTHNATSLILPGNANITTAAGDMLMATSEGSGNWRVNWFIQAASGTYIKTLTTAGDILYATGAAVLARLGIGTARQRLAVNAGATAPEWVADTQNTVVDATGDMLYGTADNTITRLAIGTAGQLLRVNSGATAPAWDAAITLGTEQAATSGTSIDFTSIPSWVRRISVMFDGVSTTGTSLPLIQLGDSGGIENTGYSSNGGELSTSATTTTNQTAGFGLTGTWAATNVLSGSFVLTLEDSTNNTWTAMGISFHVSGFLAVSAGLKALSATLDRVRLTTVGGTDTFDAGAINISYE